MKKRLLITSIVMMLVVAVALSTATYAWFTSNAVVSANSVTMTASVSDAQSISIGWIGGLQQTSITAVAGDALLPMCPTTSFVATGDHPTNAAAYATTDNEYGIAFTGAEIKLDDTFKTNGSAKTPYTYQPASDAAENLKAFYINNDSNVQAVKIDVSVVDIVNTNDHASDRNALAADTILEAGKTYYKKGASDTAYTKLIPGTDYVANTSKVGDAANLHDLTSNVALTTGEIYATKGVEDYVRVAVFATEAVTSNFPATVADASAYTYKCLLGKAAGSLTAYGAINEGANKSTVTATDAQNHPDFVTATTGTVIASLDPGARVYLIVKVWLDGADFTQHEGNQAASVALNFTATNVNANA